MGMDLFGSPSKPPKPSPAPIMTEGGPETRKRRRKYPQSAQIFKDEDLRLGAAGKLGM